MARLEAGTLSTETHLFIDESGDRRAGHEGDFFVFGCVATEEPAALRRAMKRTKAQLGYPKREVKSKKLSPPQRNAFLGAIAVSGAHVLPYVIHKPSLDTFHFEKGGQRAYNAHLANAVRNAAIKTSMRRTTYAGETVPLVVYPDPVIPVKRNPKPVDGLLYSVLGMTDANVQFADIVHTRSTREPGLWAADVVAGSIFYRINKRQNFGTILDPVNAAIEMDKWSVFPTSAYRAFGKLM